jgi:hypothetical protein
VKEDEDDVVGRPSKRFSHARRICSRVSPIRSWHANDGFPLLTITILLLYLHLPILSITWDRPNRLLSLVTSPLIQKEGEKHGFV